MLNIFLANHRIISSEKLNKRVNVIVSVAHERFVSPTQKVHSKFANDFFLK